MSQLTQPNFSSSILSEKTTDATFPELVETVATNQKLADTLERLYNLIDEMKSKYQTD